MRVFASVLLFLLCLVVPTSAAQHEVHLKVLATLSQTVRGVGVAPSIGLLAHPIPCSQPYPSDVVDVAHGSPGDSMDQCRIATPSHAYTDTVQNRRVEAMLTTETGKTYYVVLGCQRQYGWCAPLAEHANYVGKLSDHPKWLADYQHRPVNGFMKVSLRPDGKKKVSYAIQYATKVGIVKP